MSWGPLKWAPCKQDRVRAAWEGVYPEAERSRAAEELGAFPSKKVFESGGGIAKGFLPFLAAAKGEPLLWLYEVPGLGKAVPAGRESPS